jgi:hypothetical protein
MWVYLAIGLPIAWWYQGRDKHPENEHSESAQYFVLLILALIWPVLLLAILANLPNNPEQKQDRKK